MHAVSLLCSLSKVPSLFLSFRQFSIKWIMDEQINNMLPLNIQWLK